MAIGYDQKQKIEYNPNKKSVVNGYIDKAVSNLKSAKNKTDSVLRSKPFPSKTIIGKKFKRDPISNQGDKIVKIYGNLLSIKNDIQVQVDKYLKANSMAMGALSAIGEAFVPSIRALYNDTKIELFGFNYDEIQEMYDFYRKYRYADDMPDQQKKAWQYYDVINRILTKYSGVLSSREVIEKNPLDKDYNELPNLSDDMLKYFAYMENTFTDSSQCQGAVWLGNNRIAICDIDGKLKRGVIRIIEIDPNKPENIKIISEIPVDGHSNDIAYIPNDNVIIHPNNVKGELEAIYLDKKLNEKDREVVRNQQANGIDYDKENNKIIVTEDINVETYSYDSFFNGGEPESRTLIPDAIKDEENGIYYNLRGGQVVKDGDIYICYTGYEEDKRKYDAYGDPPDIPKGTMTAIFDSETGKCKRVIKNDSNGEAEAITFDDNGDQVWVMNCENDTYLLKSDKKGNDQVLEAKTNTKEGQNRVAKK